MSLQLSTFRIMRSRRLPQAPRLVGSPSYPRRDIPRTTSGGCRELVSATVCRTPVAISLVHTASMSSTRKLDILPHEETDPVERFRTHLHHGTLDYPIAATCLKEADLADRLDAKLGLETVKWLLESDDRVDVSESEAAVIMLQHTTNLLVREGQEELLWDWMQKQPGDQGMAGGRPASRFQRRACALRALVETKACRSTNKQDNLDASLQAYLRAKKCPERIPLDLAKDYLINELTKPTDRIQDNSDKGKGWTKETYEELQRRCPWPRTDPALRQAFHDDIGSKNWPARKRQAFMKLYDPDKPDAEPFLQYCDRIAALGENSKLAKKNKLIKIWRLREQCRDASTVLQNRYDHFDGPSWLHDDDKSWLYQFSSCRPRPGQGRMIEPRSESSQRLKDMYRKSGWAVGW